MAKPTPFDTLLAQAIEDLRLKTEAHDALWGLAQADWSVDQNQGEIIFSGTDGIIARAPVQIVGTYSSKDGTWLWGWDHPSVVPALQKHAKHARRYGKQYGITRLTIAAHLAWNSAIAERVKCLRPGSKAYEAAIKLAEAEYDDIVSQLCASSVERQGIAFGGTPMHDPEHERIESKSISRKKALVKTRKADPDGFVSEYEYHLVQEASKWRVASLLYVDDTGKYECL
jgi:hypothetical protein